MSHNQEKNCKYIVESTEKCFSKTNCKFNKMAALYNLKSVLRHNMRHSVTKQWNYIIKLFDMFNENFR